MFKHTPTLLLTIALLLLPSLIWLEQAEASLWNNRLLIPFLEEEPNRHTPLNPTGTYLPPTISQDTSLSPDHSPYILNHEVIVTPDATLTILPGVTLLAHEFSQLTINGQLISQGAAANPIHFISNEVHPDNQLWNGLIFTDTGRGHITHTTFQHATPAITCGGTSQVSLNNIFIEQTSLDIFSQSPNCVLANSRLKSIRDGFIAMSHQPHVTSTIFQVAREPIQVFSLD